jgi:hypothetical protein
VSSTDPRRGRGREAEDPLDRYGGRFKNHGCGFDTCTVMRDGDCPYLRLERTARRLHGLSFEHAGPVEVSEVWYCRHPFHGIEVALGQDRREAQRACEACHLRGDEDEPTGEGRGTA